MARQNRLKARDRAAWYHLYARAADYAGRYPLQQKGVWEKLSSLFRHYTQVYFCDVAAFTWMGNHTHAVVRFEQPREVEPAELMRRALQLHPGKRSIFDRWRPEAWEQLRRRLFDVSELMRNIQGEFAKWFNERFDRRGHFWSERFQSTLLADDDAVLDSMLYVELNPVRAGLVDRPEMWEQGSAFRRQVGLDGWLMPLSMVFPLAEKDRVEQDYRARLYRRGAVTPEKGGAVIPPEIVADEERRGFKTRGAYLERLSHFTRGLILGGREAVADWTATLHSQGCIRRLKTPVAQGGGNVFTLRAQRVSARASPT